MGEVDELDDAVNERVAQSYERDDGPVGDPDKKLRDELRRVFERLDEQQHHEHCDDRYGEARLPARRPDAIDQGRALGLRLLRGSHPSTYSRGTPLLEPGNLF